MPLFQLVYTPTYFKGDSQFYEQLTAVAIGNPVSPVIPNYYVEAFVETVLSSATKKPTIRYR